MEGGSTLIWAVSEDRIRAFQQKHPQQCLGDAFLLLGALLPMGIVDEAVQVKGGCGLRRTRSNG